MVRPVMCSGGFMGKFAFYFNGRGSKRTFTLDFDGGSFVINPMYVPMVMQNEKFKTETMSVQC